MRTAVVAALAVFTSAIDAARAGIWTDHFDQAALGASWAGNRGAFQVTDGVLQGQSALPVAESPLNIIEIGAPSDCQVSCWINVVQPNLHVCTKGALILRHSGNNGYAFALHEATQTLELYRLSNHEMLLKRDAPLRLGRWYYVEASLLGPAMTFSVDGQPVGTVNDSESPSGAIGLAVQDADAVSFDDFTMTGPSVVGNVDGITPPELSIAPDGNGQFVIRFLALPGFTYHLRGSSTPRTHDWSTIQSFTAKLVSFEAEAVLHPSAAQQYYRVEKADCGCD